ncbi:MAG: hypothetical protein AB1558_11265, partial [Thermodesulfobacteriota bacterium]
MSQACSHSEHIGERIRLHAGERVFVHALAVSAAVHAAFLTLLLTAASVQAPGAAAPPGEGIIMAFLVHGNQSGSGKAAAPAVRKRQAPEGVALAAPEALNAPMRNAPMLNAPVRNAPVQETPAPEAPVPAAPVKVEPAENRDR